MAIVVYGYLGLGSFGLSVMIRLIGVIVEGK